MRQQGASQRSQAEPQGNFNPSDAARQARNRSLLGMAGLGGHTVRGDKNGVTVTPYGLFGPMAKSLLG